MVKCCIAAGCSNTYKENVNLFTFPRGPDLDKASAKDRAKNVCGLKAGPQRPRIFVATISRRIVS